MPAPIAPLAWTAIRIGAMAAIALMAARSRAAQPRDPGPEDVLDDLAEGLRATPQRAQDENALLGEGRFRRVIRLGPTGPGLEIDAAALGRLRLRRVG